MTGQGHEVQYDFPGLEKSLVDHFIQGKPHILLEIPYVVYRRDIHSVEQFNKINENLHPQVCVKNVLCLCATACFFLFVPFTLFHHETEGQIVFKSPTRNTW